MGYTQASRSVVFEPVVLPLPLLVHCNLQDILVHSVLLCCMQVLCYALKQTASRLICHEAELS